MSILELHSASREILPIVMAAQAAIHDKLQVTFEEETHLVIAKDDVCVLASTTY